MRTPIAAGSRPPHGLTRRAITIAVVVALVAAIVALFIAWSHGAFESRLAYWQERGQDCGQVSYYPNQRLTSPAAAQQATACFAEAYTRCQAATLTRDAPGTDTDETDVFVIETNDHGPGCAVGMSYSFGIVGSNRTTTYEAQCATVTSANGTLTFSGCGDSSAITVP
jgi:hypothetical protein